MSTTCNENEELKIDNDIGRILNTLFKRLRKVKRISCRKEKYYSEIKAIGNCIVEPWIEISTISHPGSINRH